MKSMPKTRSSAQRYNARMDNIFKKAMLLRRVNATQEDVQEQVLLVLDALPLKERGFSTEGIAKVIAEDLVHLTINQARIRKENKK